MTYLHPKHWWMWLLWPAARCQGKSWQEQVVSGVQSFDLRVFWDSSGKLEYRHGAVSFPADNFEEFMEYCSRESATVRLFFEDRGLWYLKGLSKSGETRFKKFCEELTQRYPRVKFYGGRNTRTWEVLYDFGPGPTVEDYYSSATGLFGDTGILRVIDDIFPWLYSWLKNPENLRKAVSPETVYLYDFL